MSAKEFLSESYYIGVRIKAKEEQIETLRARAEKVTAILTDMPKGGGKRTMSDIIDHIADLEAEIATDTDELVGKQQEIKHLINCVDNEKYKTLLELRYLNHYDWQKIADKMHFSYRYTTKMHGWALKEIEKIGP